MFAMEKNGKFFSYNRLFLYRTNIHNRNDILMHVVTQSYITHQMRGTAIAIATTDPAQAINIKPEILTS